MQTYELSPETSYILDPVSPGMTHNHIKLLLQKYQESSRRRHRYCFHQNPNVDLHDIIICYDSGSYIPPNKHTAKSESLLLLEGELEFFLFNDNGQVYDYRRLSAANSAYPFYIRVPPNTWHGLRAIGKQPCIIKETIAGPYDHKSLLWAPFAPSENDGVEAGLSWYQDIFHKSTEIGISPPPDEVYEQVHESLFRSTRQLVTVTKKQLQPIVNAANSSPLKRARLCCHHGPEEKLQEMFIALAAGVSIDESVHLGKDESLTVISGQGRYLFPNEDGTIRQEVRLACFSEAEDTDHSFFRRINRYVPHKIIVDNSTILIHEATTGPFLKSHTDYRLKRIDQ